MANISEYHANNVYDVELSDVGHLQCQNLADHMATLRIENPLIIVSPLKRAKQTATYISNAFAAINTAVDIIVTDLCREHRDCKANFLDNEPVVYETEESFVSRLNSFMNLLNLYLGRNIIVVSHHGFIKRYTGHGLRNACYVSI
jgi:broad specificity phosphatase PhoE